MQVAEFAQLFDMSPRGVIPIINDYIADNSINPDSVGTFAEIDDSFAKSVVYAKNYIEGIIPSISDVMSMRVDSVPLKRRPYVYWLFNSDKLVYIGQTVNPIGRLATHQMHFEFDSAGFTTDFSGIHYIDYESLAIRKFKPPENRGIITNGGLLRIALKYAGGV
jgi:hypothetical protein